jgi:hypothetical protein
MRTAKRHDFILPYEPSATAHRNSERLKDFARMLDNYRFRRSPSIVPELSERKEERPHVPFEPADVPN